jgi:hypothetical protein
VLAGCGGKQEPPKIDVEVAHDEGTPSRPAAANAPAAPGETGGGGTLPPPSTTELPAGHPPLEGGAPAAGMGGVPVPVVEPDAGQGVMALLWTPPADWTIEPPSNSMRRAQYRVPGPGGDGECVVFYFGPGQGGDPRANAERWASQFVLPGGGSALATMKTRESKVNGAPVLFVETTGTYMSGGMMGDAPVPKEGWALLGAVVEGPDANWFFKFTGPAATVEAERAAFESMIGSVRRGS